MIDAFDLERRYRDDPSEENLVRWQRAQTREGDVRPFVASIVKGLRGVIDRTHVLVPPQRELRVESEDEHPMRFDLTLCDLPTHTAPHATRPIMTVDVTVDGLLRRRHSRGNRHVETRDTADIRFNTSAGPGHARIVQNRAAGRGAITQRYHIDPVHPVMSVEVPAGCIVTVRPVGAWSVPSDEPRSGLVFPRERELWEMLQGMRLRSVKG